MSMEGKLESNWVLWASQHPSSELSLAWPSYSISKGECIVSDEVSKEERLSLQPSALDSSWGFINNL